LHLACDYFCSKIQNAHSKADKPDNIAGSHCHIHPCLLGHTVHPEGSRRGWLHLPASLVPLRALHIVGQGLSVRWAEWMGEWAFSSAALASLLFRWRYNFCEQEKDHFLIDSTLPCARSCRGEGPISGLLQLLAWVACGGCWCRGL
jgi:hypothetical protein